ncbi:hypothetical protein CROQUDRAFT_132992 [Cronartium quercuum f. sp. fusiforme G11]|uniref:Uncharacterized protein n=1 Tax=Cronartium quercuum f. sp. fusiforme G11 TaxID=708437 RepID=A0A9P6NIM8_9BASI|nr:hypothetical protein CROQUDRAFT_132992 [Cronartium quercuum f. sp. fusiforme G11]
MKDEMYTREVGNEKQKKDLVIAQTKQVHEEKNSYRKLEQTSSIPIETNRSKPKVEIGTKIQSDQNQRKLQDQEERLKKLQINNQNRLRIVQGLMSNQVSREFPVNDDQRKLSQAYITQTYDLSPKTFSKKIEEFLNKDINLYFGSNQNSNTNQNPENHSLLNLNHKILDQFSLENSNLNHKFLVPLQTKVISGHRRKNTNNNHLLVSYPTEARDQYPRVSNQGRPFNNPGFSKEIHMKDEIRMGQVGNREPNEIHVIHKTEDFPVQEGPFSDFHDWNVQKKRLNSDKDLSNKEKVISSEKPTSYSIEENIREAKWKLGIKNQLKENLRLLMIKKINQSLFHQLMKENQESLVSEKEKKLTLGKSFDSKQNTNIPLRSYNPSPVFKSLKTHKKEFFNSPTSFSQQDYKFGSPKLDQDLNKKPIEVKDLFNLPTQEELEEAILT